ncbi:MAG: hypothetical protein EBZ77_01445 [Chitinophagia bacterium]|nr:hypothetical protein [Chitinophagia bacterium]
MVADKDFVYQPNELEKEQQNSDQKGENDRNSAMRNIIEWLTSKTGVFFLRALLVVFVACLLYLIIKNVVLPNRGRSRTKLSKANDVEGALAANNDWQTLLEKAIAARDTRMIVRYSFMGVLHLLQDNNLIAYRDDKTNYDYYQELKATDYKQPFRNLSRVYEYTWYGNYSINDNTLQQYMGIFNGLKQQLQRS